MLGTRWRAAVLAAALVLTGCAASTERDAVSTTDVAPSAGASAASTTEPVAQVPELSAFEQQLPLSGVFVSQQVSTTGSVRIERRPDGTTWVTFTGFTTGDVSDLRLYLKEGALEQDNSGAWVDTAGLSYEIGVLDPAGPDFEVQIPGAHTMPEIHTLTVMDYLGPDYPSLGSVALNQ